MMPVEKAIEAAKTLVKPVNPGQPAIGGPQREQMHTHEFVGANAVVTELLGAKQHAAIAVQRLQNAASIALELPEQAAAGAIVRFKVKVRNETAGHNLPTSLTDVRQVWVEVVATGRRGRSLPQRRAGRGGDRRPGSRDVPRAGRRQGRAPHRQAVGDRALRVEHLDPAEGLGDPERTASSCRRARRGRSR